MDDVLHYNYYTQRRCRIHLCEVMVMGEVRASLPEVIHRQLKEEAARKGLHLKVLIAKILQEHLERQKKQ